MRYGNLITGPDVVELETRGPVAKKVERLRRASAGGYASERGHRGGCAGRSGANMDIQDGNGHPVAAENGDGIRLVRRTRPPAG